MSVIHCECLCFREQEKVRRNNLFTNIIFVLAICYCGVSDEINVISSIKSLWIIQRRVSGSFTSWLPVLFVGASRVQPVLSVITKMSLLLPW